MPNEPIGGLNVLGDVNSAMETLNDYLKKAGAMNDKFLEQMKESEKVQSDFSTNLQKYIMSMGTIITQNKEIKDIETERLRKVKEIHDNEKLISDEKNRAANIQKQEEKRLGTVQRFMQDPGKTLGTELGGSVKKYLTGSTGLYAAIALEAGRQTSKMVSDMRNIARTGGMGMMEGIGLGGAAELEGQMRMAATAIPFLKEKYGTKEEMQQGAGIMFGMGGIRGEALTEVFEDLPRKAYMAGMGFKDVAQIMAKSNRVLKETPQEMKDSFDFVTSMAKENGYAIKSFNESVYKATFELATYGVNAKEVAEMMNVFQEMVQRNIMTEANRNKYVAMAVKEYDSLNDRMTYLNKVAAGLSTTMVKGTEFLDIQNRIRQSVIAVMENLGDANALGAVAATELAEEVRLGTYNLDILSSSASDLHSIFKLNGTQVIAFGKSVNEYTKRIGANGAEFTRGILDMAKGLTAITQDPRTSLATASKITANFSEELRDGVITFGDLKSSVLTMKEKFDMTNGEIIASGKLFKDVGENIGVSASQVQNWTMQLGEGTREMFSGPKEAMANAGVVIAAFGDAIADGKMTVQDYDGFMRKQMDIMGTSAFEATDKFDFLVEIVDKTNVRMAELTQYTEDLAKINRQYGYEQEAAYAIMATFTEQIRAGAMAAKDLQQVMKGAAGGTEEFRMLIVNELVSKGGEIAKVFEGVDPLAAINVVLPELQRYLAEAEKNLGATVVTKMPEALADIVTRRDIDVTTLVREGTKALDEAWRESITDIIGKGPLETQISNLQKLSQQLFGVDFQSWPEGIEKIREFISGNLTGDELKTLLQSRQKEEDKNIDTISSEYDKFGKYVDKFGSSVGTLSKIYAEAWKMEVEQKTSEDIMKRVSAISPDDLKKIPSMGTYLDAEYKKAAADLGITMGLLGGYNKEAIKAMKSGDYEKVTYYMGGSITPGKESSVKSEVEEARANAERNYNRAIARLVEKLVLNIRVDPKFANFITTEKMLKIGTEMVQKKHQSLSGQK